MKRRKTSSRRPKSRFGSRRADVVKLLQRGVQTVAELATELHLTDNAVRSHLIALKEEGLVARSGLQQGTRRPHEVFQLTRRAHKHLAHAAEGALNALLEAMKQRLSAKQLRALLKGGGTQLGARFGDRGGTLRARVQNAARLLNSLGGSARVEKNGDGLRIRSQGCPLASVVAEHPETCLLVENFLARIVNAEVREHCDRGPHSRCRFDISPKLKPGRATQTDKPIACASPPCYLSEIED